MLMILLAQSFALLENQAAAWDEAEAPGAITIAGTSYVCARFLSPVRNELTESGWRRVQTAVVLVRKNLLATCPTYDSTITMDSLSWFLVEAGGQDAEQPAWKLTIKRHLPNPS